jgi:hypothetical protein
MNGAVGDATGTGAAPELLARWPGRVKLKTPDNICSNHIG